MTEGFAGLLAGILEILVVGAGGLAWIALVVLAATHQPISAVNAGSSEGLAAVALVTMLYVLGVVIDRLADRILDTPERLAAKKTQEAQDAYRAKEDTYRVRRMQMQQSPELFARSEYIRSRLRVVRGWTLNATLLAPSWAWYAARNIETNKAASLASGVVVSFAVAVGCYVSWRELRDTERAQVKLFFDNRGAILGR